MDWQRILIGACVSTLSACSILFSPVEEARARDLDGEATKVDAGVLGDANSFFSCGPEIDGVIGLFSLGSGTGVLMKNSVAGPDGRFLGTDGMTANPTVVDTGFCGSSLDFSDNSSASYGELESDTFADARSIDFWFHPGSRAEGYPIEGLLTKDTLLGNNGDFGLYIVRNSEDGHQLVAYRQIDSDVSVNCSTALPKDQWHHVAVSFTETGVQTVYLDGEKLSGTMLSPDDPIVDGDVECAPSQLVGTSPSKNSQGWRWGTGPSNTDSEKNTNFFGLVDELRFRDKEMDEGEATNIYETGINSLSGR